MTSLNVLVLFNMRPLFLHRTAVLLKCSSLLVLMQLFYENASSATSLSLLLFRHLADMISPARVLLICRSCALFLVPAWFRSAIFSSQRSEYPGVTQAVFVGPLSEHHLSKRTPTHISQSASSSWTSSVSWRRQCVLPRRSTMSWRRLCAWRRCPPAPGRRRSSVV